MRCLTYARAIRLPHAALAAIGILASAAVSQAQTQTLLTIAAVSAQPSAASRDTAIVRRGLTREPVFHFRTDSVPVPSASLQVPPAPRPSRSACGSRCVSRTLCIVASTLVGMSVGSAIGVAVERRGINEEAPGYRGFFVGAPIGGIVGGWLGGKLTR